MGIWGQIYPICWRLWSSARDDFDLVCLAKWNQYINIRYLAASDVLPIKHHHSKWREFPKCPSHKHNHGGVFQKCSDSCYVDIKAVNSKLTFSSMRARSLELLVWVCIGPRQGNQGPFETSLAKQKTASAFRYCKACFTWKAFFKSGMIMPCRNGWCTVFALAYQGISRYLVMGRVTKSAFGFSHLQV